MKKLQNKSLAGTRLGVKGNEYLGDAEGVFEMKDADAAVIAGTPGWTVISASPKKNPGAAGRPGTKLSDEEQAAAEEGERRGSELKALMEVDDPPLVRRQPAQEPAQEPAEASDDQTPQEEPEEPQAPKKRRRRPARAK